MNFKLLLLSMRMGSFIKAKFHVITNIKFKFKLILNIFSLLLDKLKKVMIVFLESRCRYAAVGKHWLMSIEKLRT